MGSYESKKNIFQLLSSNGDGTGITNAVGDYSSSPISLKIVPDISHEMVINQIVITIEDKGTLDSGGYGNGGELTNGIIFSLKNDSGLIFDLTPVTVTKNSDWASNGGLLSAHQFGIGNEIITVSWPLLGSGRDVVLRGRKGEYLDLSLNDDFTHLVAHLFVAQGYHNQIDY